MMPQASNTLTAKTFAAKARSKRELHLFLCVDVGAYLPGPDCINIYFMKALCDGSKKFILSAEVKYLSCPQYEGLATHDILSRIADYPDLQKYLPDPRDIARVPRQWLINVVNTLVFPDFSQWVGEKIMQRNNKLAVDQNLIIELDPRVMKAFQESTAISTVRGSACHLLKSSSKRRKTKEEIMKLKALGEPTKERQAQLEEQVAKLEKQLAQASSQIRSNQSAANILNQFIDEGSAEIDENGRVSISKRRPESSEM